MSRPRVVILRGHQVNPWELRPWEQLAGRYEVAVLVPRRHPYPLGSLALERVQARTLSDLLPVRFASDLAAPLPWNRYLGLRSHLAGADIVHAAELHFWFTAQAAALKASLGFGLVTTVWETIPFRAAARRRVTRPNRRRALEATDLFLATTGRARDALLLEGVEEARIAIVPPGVDVGRFAVAGAEAERRGENPLVISPGRLVWEKGHQDVLRAIAALRGGLVDGPAAARGVRLLVLGSGPEERRLRAYAADLGLRDDAVEFRASVPYDEMPAMYARASAMVLASLPIRSWEEQFGMVLAEAMAAGLPVVTTTSGAIPEVVNGAAALVAPGDWMALARALADGPLRHVGQRAQPAGLLERLGAAAAADRLAAVYERVLGARGS